MIDSIKKAFVLSVKALKLFYVLVTVNVVMSIINLLILPAPVDVEMSLGRSFLVIGLTILFMLIGFFVYSGALVYIKDLIKTGSTGLAPFMDNGKKYFLKLLALGVIITLIFAIFGVILFVILGLLPGALKGLFIVFMVLSFIALAVLFVMPYYALIGSDLGIIEAIKKGLMTGKNNFLKILGILAIMFLIGVAVVLVASLVSGIFSFISGSLSGFITAIIMSIANSVLAILANIAYMDFYLKNSQ